MQNPASWRFDENRLVWLAALAIVLAGPFAAMPPLEKS
jgi:hypothetical protein